MGKIVFFTSNTVNYAAKKKDLKKYCLNLELTKDVQKVIDGLFNEIKNVNRRHIYQHLGKIQDLQVYVDDLLMEVEEIQARWVKV